MTPIFTLLLIRKKKLKRYKLVNSGHLRSRVAGNQFSILYTRLLQFSSALIRRKLFVNIVFLKLSLIQVLKYVVIELMTETILERGNI